MGKGKYKKMLKINRGLRMMETARIDKDKYGLDEYKNLKEEQVF